jgi:hypothetical protein
MAQVVLSAVGSAIAGPIGGAIGSVIGGYIDQQAIASLMPARQVGPRIPELRLQSTGEGAPILCVFGRARIAGQIIWAARFKERRIESRTGGGKGGGGQKTVEYRYSLSFAVGLCEGPIDGVGRVWADGKPMDMSGVVMRVHAGAEDQTPDALIEAVEGEAPAYRGLAYVVFEDLPLAAYGNRPPQLSFEIFRRPRVGDAPALEDMLTGVCLIPGAGEFVYATQTVQRRDGLTRITAENVNNTDGRTDLVVSLDQLQAQLPNVEEVMLVVAWFGSDLRCGECLIRPGVEQAVKQTIPFSWRVCATDRDEAHLISTIDGGPAYGGTPADTAVLQAIAEIKARGLKVGLYPFILMDVPPGNGLPDPYGGSEQAAFPWRGRITCAAGTDKTAAVTGQVGDFFGAAVPGDFGASGGEVTYAGPAEWGLRRMVLHYAKIAAMAGGVDTFLIGSELRGLTTLRNSATAYPAVDELIDLAADCRTILGGSTALGYAADWSEYFGHQPADGTGDVFFHLDPLWADAEIDFVGIDYYVPLADWRDGDDHLDALAGFEGPHDTAYIEANIEGGEGFDWYYASQADRDDQVRTQITDGAYGEPWVYRPKDLRSWWENAHHNRPLGVRSGTATAWVPESKPVRLIEFGCPAVDKGANSPNLFIDPKSSESFLPPYSDGTRDDYGQRRCLEAVLEHWAGDPMIEAMNAWCWDARPFPDFPGRTNVWADGPNWSLGHWLTGRAGVAPVADLVVALAERADVELDPGGVGGVLTGYVVDRPMRLRDALAPLAQAFAFDGAERDGLPTLIGRDGPLAATLDDDDLAWPDKAEAPRSAARTLEGPADVIRLRFIDETADYQTGALTVRRDPAGAGDTLLADLPMVMAAPQAERIARRALSRSLAVKDEAIAHLSPLTALSLEAGDVIEMEEVDGRWRVVRLDLDEQPRAHLEAAEPPEAPTATLPEWTPPPAVEPAGPPVLHLMDLPPLPGSEEDARPVVAAACDPWRAMDVHAGASASALTVRARVAQSAAVGETLSTLPVGPLHRLDQATRLTVRVEGALLQSRDLDAVLAGANALAVFTPAGEWEILQFTTTEAVDDDTWELSGLLRGQAGSDPAMVETPSGAAVVVLDDALERGDVSQWERGLPLTWRAAPAGGPPSGSAMTEAAFTWSALALRPWSPAHLRMEAETGGLALSWIRRARLHGDNLDTEPPLGEEAERYRVEVLDGPDVVRTAEVTAPSFLYTTAMQTADFPSGTPDPLTVRVAQHSAAFGWGAACTRELWQ